MTQNSTSPLLAGSRYGLDAYSVENQVNAGHGDPEVVTVGLRQQPYHVDIQDVYNARDGIGEDFSDVKGQEQVGVGIYCKL